VATHRPKFGLNVNNREPLIAPQSYSLVDLLNAAQAADEAGMDSVWVGDSLFSKPRFEPIALLAAISQRTRRVKLGTACMVTATRNPLYLALEWTTLDHLSAGRMILGACMGNPDEEGVRREFEAVGLDYGKRAGIFEEGLAVLRQLWTQGTANFKGDHYTYQDISFYSGTEHAPLMPVQTPPPIWIVSNPRLILGTKDEDRVRRVIERVARRVAQYGDGWMACCRSRHPEELRIQKEGILHQFEKAGRNADDFIVSYQVTMNIGESRQQAEHDIGYYISHYYPELSQKMDLAEWGPVGTPDDIVRWLRNFVEAGVDHFIVRFGAMNQLEQVARFQRHVLPAFR
jgi:alkanesulfonate monooxygenase SsuD/methylene tetrahydromethanopterin reductase-like flavin-dependent oxidoreductase (luciferase family)